MQVVSHQPAKAEPFLPGALVFAGRLYGPGFSFTVGAHMLRDDQSRCVGRSDLSPDSVTCPKREQCARYVDLRDRGADFAWTHISVYTHVCGDPELSAFIAVEGEDSHAAQCAVKPCGGESHGQQGWTESHHPFGGAA